MTRPAVIHSATPPPDPWWRYAQGCARALIGGLEPPTVTVYGPVLDDDELPRLCTTAGISRLISGDGSYQRSSLLLFGTPGLTLGMLAAQGLVNHRRRQQAPSRSSTRLALAPARRGHRYRPTHHVQRHRRSPAELLVRRRHRVLSRPSVAHSRFSVQ